MERNSLSQRTAQVGRAAIVRKLFVCIGLAALALLIPGDWSAAQQPGNFAQFRIFRGMAGNAAERAQGVDGVFLPADRETTLKLERAKEMLAKGQVADAVIELDRILDQREDFFFKPDPNQTVHRSLKAEAQRLLGGLDKEQRAIYELQFGTSARQLLDAATRAGSIERLSDVLRRYFHTDAGYEAALVLARHHMDHNRPLAAALVLERMKNAPAALERYEPNLSVLLAACWIRAGLDDKANVALSEVKRDYSNARLQLAGKSFRLASNAEQNFSALAAIVAKDQTRLPVEAANWSMPKGNVARNAAMSGGSPLLNVRWSSRVFNSGSLSEELVKLRKQYIDSGRAVIPSAQPLAVGDVVLMRTPHALFGLEFESGKRIWPWPLSGPGDEMVNAGRDAAYMQLLGERMWENNTYGTMSSDGELIFLIHEGDIRQAAASAPLARMPRALVMPNGQVFQGTQATHNVLSAHSLRREGALEWHVGGLESEMEPQLAGAYFLGPPLPLQGQLYALAEIKGGISLVVVDAKTGKLEWTQQLAMVDQNVQFDPFRRMSGASPSFADGVLVCPTAAGALVAVDLATRSLVWGFQYPHTQEQERMQQQRVNMGWNINGNMASVTPGSHWVDSTAVIADGRVFMTAVESDQLHCMSLPDGKQLWPPKKRENGLYIGAVSGDRLILVGEQQVEALDVADGKSLWSTPLASNRPSGRGFYSGGHYYLPLSSAEVIKIELTKGEIKARARSRSGNIPGNLICYNGFVISQGVESLDKYFQLDPLRKHATETLAKTPDDPEALAWRGEIALDDGNLAQAVADLRKSYAFRPAADADADYLSRIEGERLRTRELLIDALTAALAQDFTANKGSLAELEGLVENDQERARYLRVLASGQQEEGNRSEALSTYLKLADLRTDPDQLEEVETGLSVRRDRWIGARLEQLWKDSADADRATLEATVAERLERALSAKGDQDNDTRAARLRQFIATFGFHELADTAREKLLLELGERDSALERERLLARLEKSPDRGRAGAAVARLASLYESAEADADAAMYYHKLGSEFTDVVCLDGKTGKELVAALPSDYRVRRAMEAATAWPVGKVEEKPSRASTRNQPYQQYHSVEIQGDRRPFFAGRHVQFDNSMYQLVGRDALGREFFRAIMNEGGQFNNYAYGYNTTHAVVDGHLLILNTGFRVTAINTLRPIQDGGKRVMWHEHVINPMQLQMQQMMGIGGVSTRTINSDWGLNRTIATSIGAHPVGAISPVVDGGVAILSGRELKFVDALSGKPLWVRHNVPSGSEVYGDAEILIVAPADTNDALVFSTRNGELLGTRKTPTLDLRWATWGRNVLTWKERGRSLELMLLDVWSGKQIEMGVYPTGSKGIIVGGDSVAIYDASGKFVVRSLADGRKLVEAEVEPDSKLHNIHVQRTSSQYLLISNGRRLIKSSSRQDNYQAIPDANGMNDNYNNGLVCGRVYAFDRATGEPQWQVPALIDMHGYVAGQGTELPVLIFLRQAYQRQMKVSMLCLDKRTGRAVYQNDNLGGQAHAFEASADPEARTVAMQFPGQSVQLTYTDAPVAPEPPYQAGAEPPRAAAASGSKLGSFFEILGKAAGELQDGAKNQPRLAPPQQAPQAPPPDPFERR